MQIDTKYIRFGYVISHTFPGFILSIELMIGIDMLTNKRICFLIFQQMDFLSIVGILGIFAIGATIFGLIIDAIQHFIFENLIDKIITRKGEQIYEAMYVHKVIKTMEHFLIYQHLIEDAFWYYYEAYANIAISLILGFFVIAPALKKLGVGFYWAEIIRFSIIPVIILLFLEAITTYQQAKTIEKEFADNISSK